MGKIVVSEFMSLDGVVEAPETWHFPFITDDMQAVVNQQILDSAAFLYGRVTYDIFAGFWPNQTGNEIGFEDHLNGAPKYVVSSTLKKADWNNTTLINGDVAAGIRQMKQAVDGIIGMAGSVTLIQWLMQAGFVDEYLLYVHPIVLGKGWRLFEEGVGTHNLKLIDSRTFQGGVVMLHYQSTPKAE